jgi:predicted nucleic acid-binding protein
VSAIYFDTSVLVPCYVPEVFSAAAEQRVRKEVLPRISDLTVVEFSAALARKVRDKVLTAPQASSAYALFRRHVADGMYRRIALGPARYDEAAELLARVGLRHPLRSLDSIHAAVTLGDGLRLVTADEHLAEAVRAAGGEAELLKVSPQARLRFCCGGGGSCRYRVRRRAAVHKQRDESSPR